LELAKTEVLSKQRLFPVICRCDKSKDEMRCYFSLDRWHADNNASEIMG
jgi:hypothetical protein